VCPFPIYCVAQVPPDHELVIEHDLSEIRSCSPLYNLLVLIVLPSYMIDFPLFRLSTLRKETVGIITFF